MHIRCSIPRVLVVSAFLLFCFSEVAAGRSIYVDDDAPNDLGAGDPGISDPWRTEVSDRLFRHDQAWSDHA